MRAPHLLLLTILIAFAGCDDTAASPQGPARADTGVRPSPDAGDATGQDAEGDGSGDAGEQDADTSPAVPAVCSPGAASCVTLDVAGQCNELGTQVLETRCADGTWCVENGGVCTPGICRPFTNRCAGVQDRQQCSVDAQRWEPGAACDGDEYCSAGACLPAQCLPNVMFIVDGSSSMANEFAAIRASINDVTLANPGVAYGLSMFPTALGCSIGDGSPGIFGGAGVTWPHVPIALEGPLQIDAWFGANRAAGGATPLISTLEWFADNAETIWGPIRENRHLVVMTEGADTCRCSGGNERQCWIDRGTTATLRLRAADVRVYVIGYRFSDAPDALNAIAENGGTPFTTFIPAGDEATLTAAFGEVIASTKLCE